MPESPKTKAFTVPPPVKGLIDNMSIAQMDSQYALAMENYISDGQTVDLRNGYQYYSKGMAGAIFTVAALEFGSVSKLVAIDIDKKAWDASASQANATDISGGVALQAAYCNTFQFRDRLFIKPVASSGANSDVYHYTGTGNITASAFTGPGGDDKDLYCIGAYKSRLYFSQGTAASLWYGGVDAVTGVLTEYPVSSLFTRPFKYIAFVGSVARTKEYAEDDLLCACSDSGEVLLFQGDYPGSTTWSVVGRYVIPKPLHFRSFFYFGSSLYIQTEDGTIAVKDLMSGQNTGYGWPSISDNIDTLMSADHGYAVDSFAQGIVYPKGKYLLLNIQLTAYPSFTSAQYIMNLRSGAWSKFTNQKAYCWVVWAGNLYFGTDSGKVMKADIGNYDEDPANLGSVLTRNTKLRCAFSFLGAPDLIKTVTQVVPLVYESQGLSLTIDADVDFSDTAATSTLSDSTTNSNVLYKWPAGVRANPGKAFSIRVDGTVTTKDRSFQAFEVFWKEADIR